MANLSPQQMLQRQKMMGNILSQPPVNVPTDGSYSGNVRARTQASNDNNWQKMLQAAAMASMMDNKTALGFGLGSLLAANWDKWFGKKKKGYTNQGDTAYTIGGSAPQAPPMNMSVDSNGVIHYEQPLPNGYELGNIAYSGTGTEVPPATLTPNNGTFTQQMGLDNYKAQNPIDMSTNPANRDNWFKENMATNPWNMSAPSVPEIQNNALGVDWGMFDPNSEQYKKWIGGGK